MGVYFFNPEVFDYIDKTPPSRRTGKVELTDVIQVMVDDRLAVHVVPFEGDYLNVTCPEDILIADRMVSSYQKRKALGWSRVGLKPPQTSSVPHHQPPRRLKDKPIKTLVGPEHRVLLLRTIRMRLFENLVADLQQSIGARQMDVLCQQAVRDQVLRLVGPEHVRIFPREGLFSLGLAELVACHTLRGEQYDRIVLPFSSIYREGYTELQLFCKLIGKTVIGVVPPTTFFPILWSDLVHMGSLPKTVTLPLERAVFHSIRILTDLRT
jgi:hypothetical protein